MYACYTSQGNIIFSTIAPTKGGSMQLHPQGEKGGIPAGHTCTLTDVNCEPIGKF